MPGDIIVRPSEPKRSPEKKGAGFDIWGKPRKIELEGTTIELGPKDTIIDGVVYDLTNFSDHPGGETAISWAYGRDATALFRSYHIWNDKPRKLLQKYRKAEQPPELAEALKQLQSSSEWKNKRTQQQGWTWDDDFTEEAIQMVRDHFKGKDHFASWKKLAIMAVLFCMFLYTGILWFQGIWWTCVAFPFISWILGVHTLHDASHRAMSKTGWINDAYMIYALPFTSPIMWYHQHVIGHHTAPNTRQDPDLRHGARLWRYNKNSPHKWWHKYQLAYFQYLWIWSVFALALLWDFFTVKTGYYRNTIPLKGLRWLPHLADRAYSIFVIFIMPYFFQPLHQAVVWGFTWYFVIGLLFAAISQVNHVSPAVLEAFDQRWYPHQAATAVNYGRHSSLIYWMTGGLNFQIEHHMFPGINHEHLPALAPKLEALCKKHGVQYPYVKTYTDALLLHLDVLIDCAKLEEKVEKVD